MIQPSDAKHASEATEPDLASMLPGIYRDGRVAAAVFVIPFDRARRAVTPPDLYPIALPGKRAFAVLCSFDYLDTTLGPYRELAIGVVASTEHRLGALRALDLLSAKTNTGAWVLALPVTSELACRGGIELFGYPKTTCGIDVEHSSSSCSTLVRDSADTIIRMSLPLGRGPKLPVRSLVTYAQRNGQLLRMRAETQWRVTVCSGRGARIEAQTPQHPLCRTLQQLELPNSPLFVLHGDRFRAILRAGERV